MARRKIACGVLLASALLLVASPAFARIEITALFGYRWGGTLDTDAGDLELEAAPQFGAIVGYGMGESGQVDFSYTAQTGHLLQKSADGGADEPQFEVRTEYWQLGYLYAFSPPEGLQPFVSVSLGATRFDPAPSDREASWAFSGSFGLGAKFFFSENLGLRGDARINSTSLPTSNYFCTDSGGCYSVHSTYMNQVSLSLGLIYAF